MPVPADVTLIMEMHANEFSALIAKQDFWGKTLWKLVFDIQEETRTQIMLADQVCDREMSEFNRVGLPAGRTPLSDHDQGPRPAGGLGQAALDGRRRAGATLAFRRSCRSTWA